jgi:hypothetical protein
MRRARFLAGAIFFVSLYVGFVFSLLVHFQGGGISLPFHRV